MKFILALLALIAYVSVSVGDRIEVVPNIEKRHIINSLKFDYLTSKSDETPLNIASRYMSSKLSGLDWIITNKYTSKHNGVTHIYTRQVIQGLEVANAVANINVDSEGKVINFAENFFNGTVGRLESSSPRMTPLEAIKAFAKFIKVPINKAILSIKFSSVKNEGIFTGSEFSEDNIPVKLMLAQTENGESLKLVWHITVRRGDNWWDAYVDTTTGEIVNLFDWFKGAQYNVYALPVNDPLDGDRSVVVDPHKANPEASPLGWHNQGDATFTDTIGNNVYAQENIDGGRQWEDNYRPDGGKELVFDYPIDFKQDPVEYLDASITNLFYWSNIVHDIFYNYGFDEVSGNFQENNFERGGLGSDAVQANAQDGSGYNNANFATPPDGQRPRMRMYVWNQVSPMLDGDLDNGIIVHEYGHGITNRLTGGPANSNCLSGGQAGGMGEGWSDCFSLFFRWKSEYSRNSIFGMGEYAAGRGIRPYPYAYDMSINPTVYETINGASYSGVHAKGCVWCTVLMDIYHVMYETYGFDDDWYNGKGGNNMYLQILVDSFKLQPCNPTFVDTRDAMIAADQVLFKGANYCILWRGFARRGLGLNAVDTNNRVRNDFSVPAGC